MLQLNCSRFVNPENATAWFPATLSSVTVCETVLPSPRVPVNSIVLLADGCIDQAVVYGEGRNFLTGLIVPQWDNVRKALAADGVSLDGLGEEALAKHPAVNALLRKRIDAALADVSSWEHVKKFVVLPRPFSVAAEELTVSLKLRRDVVFASQMSTASVIAPFSTSRTLIR